MDDNNQTTTVTKGTVINADLSKEMKTSFMDYAMSVIVARALPDVRDGLKPVHRRILYDMWELGIKSSGEFKKSARVVGDVLGKYHPHGDASVYDALVRLAQNFSQRYIVVKPHGNFGSIDGDPPAAMRYTEAKMAVLGEEMLVDIQKETVNMIDNYDGSLQEPEVLPASFPFLLANGSSGIAVGMATNMPPHNLTEICNAAISMIDNPEIDSEGLMNYIKGPDFPTSAVICGTKGIREAYLTGRGKVVMRAVYEIEELKNHTQIVFTQIPYQVNKARLHERILELRREEIIKGIGEVRDETSEKGGIRLVVELKKGAVASVVVNCLFKHTDLQCNFNVINLALVDGRPKILTLRDLIYYYLKHREDVVTRRTQFDLRKAQERAHILRGLKIALDNIDRVIQIIKQSKDNSVAIQSLMKEFGLDEIQGKAIIDMKLGRLSNLETQQILDELAELENKIAFYEKVLSSKDELLKVIKGEIEEMRDKYGDERRTVISPIELGNSNIEDFIKKEDVVVTATAKGFIKRVPLLEYKAQGRGGKGTRGVTLRGEDRTVAIYSCNTHDYLMFFTNHGKAFYCKVYEIEDASKTGKGSSIKSILQLEENEDITSVITFKEFEKGKSIFMLTRMGIAKRIDMFSLRNARSRGLIAMDLDENDELRFVQFVADNDEVLVVTKFAKALKYPVTEVRQMGRAARGVKGIGLKKEGDEVVGLARAGENDRCIIVNNKGKGKQVDFSLFNTHGRATGGQKIFTLAEGESIITALNASNEEDLICLTQAGQTIRIHVDAISDQGRAAKGVILFKLKKASDEIVSVAKVPRSQDEEDTTEDESEGNETPQSDSSSQDTE